jgi:hypothetical protein
MLIRQTKKVRFAVLSLAIVVAFVAVASVLVTRDDDEMINSVVPTAAPTAKSTESAIAEQPERQEQRMDSRKTYVNTKYGISFKYPEDWRVDELAVNKPSGVLPPEYVVSLKANTNEQYNDTLILQVITKPQVEVVKYFTTGYNTSKIAKDTKSEGNAKGKRMTQITTSQQNGNKTERYIFELNDKTLVVESINEELNVRRDANYWDKFIQTYNSLTVK